MEKSASKTPKGRILLVDDDESLQRAIKRVARTAGFDVVHAFDGPEALVLAMGQEFDAILLDINMPGMDGRDVLKRLKENAKTSSIPVLVHSARSGQFDRHVAFDLGAHDFIDKPMEVGVLMGKIRRMIEVSQTGADD